MKILYLGNKENIYSLKLFNILKNIEDKVYFYENKITIEDIKDLNIDFSVSYNYRHIIKKELINFLKGDIINLHISFLPWNKGAHPNLWSFIENTPTGVTIHYINEGIDTGDIIVQKQVIFDIHKETLNTSYIKLQEEIINLFLDNWEKIKSGNINRIPQNKNEGSLHYSSEFEKVKHLLNNGWHTKLCDLIKNIKNEVK